MVIFVELCHCSKLDNQLTSSSLATPQNPRSSIERVLHMSFMRDITIIIEERMYFHHIIL